MMKERTESGGGSLENFMLRETRNLCFIYQEKQKKQKEKNNGDT